MRRLPGILAPVVLAALAFPWLAPARAGAEPVAHLSWNDCGASGVVTRAFACNTNSGAEELIVSFVPPEGVETFTGIDARIRVWPPTPSLPPWWALGTGGCRSASLRVQAFAPGTSACPTPWTPEHFTFVEFNAAAQEIRAAVNLNHGQEHPLDPAVEYYGLRLTINHAKSAGSGACEGCSMPVGMYLSRLWMFQGAEFTFVFPLPEVPYVNWQCSGGPVVEQGVVTGWQFTDCATPAQGRTWGQIKALFR